MKTVKSYSYDPDIRDAVEIGDLEFTDKEYENLEHLAESWNMTIQDMIRFIVTSFFKSKELGV